MSRRLQLITKDKNINKREMLCSCLKCFFITDNIPSKVKKLCPFCLKVGYCSSICFNTDILRHVLNTCDQQIKKPIFIEND